MKKLVVFLFPSNHFVSIQEEYIKDELGDEKFKISDVFDKVIFERYKNKGFDFAIAQYNNENITGITVVPDKIVFSQANYSEFYNRDTQLIKADYDYMAVELHPELYETVIVGGYHSTDCVLKLAKSINNISSNAYVDRDLTNDFIESIFVSEKSRITGVNDTFDFSNIDMDQFVEFNNKLLGEDPYDQCIVSTVTHGIKK